MRWESQSVWQEVTNRLARHSDVDPPKSPHYCRKSEAGIRAVRIGRGLNPYILTMSMNVRFLGTSASRPTVERNVASLALEREGETMLFDCGEGTQRQMMRYRVSFALGD